MAFVTDFLSLCLSSGRNGQTQGILSPTAPRYSSSGCRNTLLASESLLSRAQPIARNELPQPGVLTESRTGFESRNCEFDSRYLVFYSTGLFWYCAGPIDLTQVEKFSSFDKARRKSSQWAIKEIITDIPIYTSGIELRIQVIKTSTLSTQLKQQAFSTSQSDQPTHANRSPSPIISDSGSLASENGKNSRPADWSNFIPF